MTDWATVAASGATAVGTLVLAGATFAAVRSSERKRSCPPRQYPPVVVTSRPDDPTQRIGFQDEHWIEVAGGRGAAEVGDEAIYLVMSLRNVGSGFAVLDRGAWSQIWPKPRCHSTISTIFKGSRAISTCRPAMLVFGKDRYANRAIRCSSKRKL